METFCGPSKIFKNMSWLISICLKYFMTPAKTLHPLPPPTYLMHDPLAINVGNVSVLCFTYIINISNEVQFMTTFEVN